jgi:hypothetical protein
VAPCVAYGNNYTLAIHGSKSTSPECDCCAPCCAHCILDAALPTAINLGGCSSFCSIPVGGCLLRAQHRLAVLEHENYISAFAAELCCGPCSLTQVYRELKRQNVTYDKATSVLGFISHPDNTVNSMDPR